MSDFLEYMKKVTNTLPDNITINSIPVSELFRLYEQPTRKHKFLYPEKKQRIESHFSLIKKNWELARKAGEDILWTMAIKGTVNESANFTFWRTTEKSLIGQHLISNGYPIGVITLMLISQIHAMTKEYKSIQNWFSNTNQFAMAVFNEAIKSIGSEYSQLTEFDYMKINRNYGCDHDKSFLIIQCKNDRPDCLYNFIKNTRGQVVADAEEYDHDIELLNLDEVYREYGLSRRRYMWLAKDKKTEEALGAIVAYRAPFGFNFSLLENRCELILANDINEKLNERQREILSWSLIAKAKQAYFDGDSDLKYPLSYIQLVTDSQTSEILKKSGAEFIHRYIQSIWTNFGAWFSHIESMLPKSLRKTHNIQ